MWIPYNLFAPLKGDSPAATITASEKDTTGREFVVSFFLRNPATRHWDCDVLVSDGGLLRRTEVAGQSGQIQLVANGLGKLEQISYRLSSSSAMDVLTVCYGHAIKYIERLIAQYGRGIEIAGWLVVDVRHDARWRCFPFRPNTLRALPDLEALPSAYDDVLRLYRETRCTTSSSWRLICPSAILDGASVGREPFAACDGNGLAANDAAVVTTDMLIRSGAIALFPELKGATLAKVRQRIEPFRNALLNAMMTWGREDGASLPIASDYDSEASLAALANLADLLAREVIFKSLRAEGHLEKPSTDPGEPLELAGLLARLC